MTGRCRGGARENLLSLLSGLEIVIVIADARRQTNTSSLRFFLTNSDAYFMESWMRVVMLFSLFIFCSHETVHMW